jgi:tetratricopeptide (TPR) repeat protein
VVFRQREKLIKTLICIGIVAATLVAYEPIRHNSFVSYDDYAYITENPNVTAGLTLESVIWAFTNAHMGNWHPLTLLSHILDYQLFGPNPVGHHFVNLLFHITNALLLFWILTNLTGVTWPSAFVAAVFALHPVHVESVAWAAERKDVLSGLFWMLTMAAYIRYARRPGTGRYVLLLLVYGLGIMTKPVVVTLPLVLLLLDYWPLGRFQRNTTPKVSLARLIKEKIPLLLLAGILSVMTLIAQRSGEAIISLEKNPLDYRIANAFLSYARYIGKMIWPSRLAVFYPHPHAGFSDAAVIVSALLLTLITAVIIYAGRRRKYLVMGWLWYIGTLVPMIGLVQVGSQAMADRYMYIPMLGLLIIIAWAVKDFVVNRPHWRIVVAVSAAVVLSSAVGLTRMQVSHWRNNITLFEHTLKITEDNIIAENNYGLALLAAGRIDEAVEHFNKVLRINKNNANAYANLGTAYSQLGKYEQATQNLTKAAELKSDNIHVLNNLAWLLATVGDVSAEDANRAVEFAHRACKLTGYREPSILDTLAAAYAAAGRFNEAIATAQQAIDAAKANGRDKLAGEIQKRIEIYRAGQPYRQKRMTDDR